jgi:ATP-binding cassette, subfamily B, bacterial HlyB/CyaB
MLDLQHISLDTIPIFQVLSPQEKEEIVASFEQVSFQMGDTIIQAGEQGDSFYFIMEYNTQQSHDSHHRAST